MNKERKVGEKFRDENGTWVEVMKGDGITTDCRKCCYLPDYCEGECHSIHKCVPATRSDYEHVYFKLCDHPAVAAEFEIHGETVVVHSMHCRDDLRNTDVLASKDDMIIRSNSYPAIEVSGKQLTLYLPGIDSQYDCDAAFLDCDGTDFTPQEIVDEFQKLIDDINEKYAEPKSEEEERYEIKPMDVSKLPDDDMDCTVLPKEIIDDAKNWMCPECGKEATPSDCRWSWSNGWLHSCKKMAVRKEDSIDVKEKQKEEAQFDEESGKWYKVTKLKDDEVGGACDLCCFDIRGSTCHRQCNYKSPWDDIYCVEVSVKEKKKDPLKRFRPDCKTVSEMCDNSEQEQGDEMSETNEKEFVSKMPYDVWEKISRKFCDSCDFTSHILIRRCEKNTEYFDAMDEYKKELMNSVPSDELEVLSVDAEWCPRKSDSAPTPLPGNTYRLKPGWQPPNEELVGEAYLKANPGCIFRIENGYKGEPVTVVVGDDGIHYAVVYQDGTSHFCGPTGLSKSYNQAVLEISSKTSEIIYPK
jgi:hypothetical protein